MTPGPGFDLAVALLFAVLGPTPRIGAAAVDRAGAAVLAAFSVFVLAAGFAG